MRVPNSEENHDQDYAGCGVFGPNFVSLLVALFLQDVLVVVQRFEVTQHEERVENLNGLAVGNTLLLALVHLNVLERAQGQQP